MTLIKKEKLRHQLKSRFYYLFWGAATVAVVAGQLYVGTSYRAMSRSMNKWFEETIDIMTEPYRMEPYSRTTPDGIDFHHDSMVLR
jgi:hypothetical protein|tara:strand:+ start:1708 stop:1965 length:258 start_codon:yes stop_codon:yes gene_type:complete